MQSAAHLFSVFLLLVTLLVSPSPVRAAEGGRAALMIAEVLTGATSASDEYVLIEATGATATSLSDIELVYRSASGVTTRRLVSLAALPPLLTGERLLIANAVGSYAAQARLTWSDGIATSGGGIVLRKISTPTEVLDAIAWGSAVAAAGGEGTPIAAPSNGVIVQRRRDAIGALIDTNENSADLTLSPSPTATPTPAPSPTATPTPAPSPAPSPTATQMPAPTPTATPSPTASPTPAPTPAPSPTATPTPAPLNVSTARSVSVGTHIRVSGVVVALQGEIAEPQLLAIQDPVSGEGIYLLAPLSRDLISAAPLARGSLIEADGVLTLRRQTLTIVTTSAPMAVGVGASQPPLVVQRPAAGAWAWEAWEGRRVRVSGTIAGSPQSLADGAISVRLRLASGDELLLGLSSSVAATISAALRESGRDVVAQGLIHQRGSSSGGGYRLWLDPVAGLVPQEVTPVPGGESVVPGEGYGGGGSSTPAGSKGALTLPGGVPTIALPSGAERGWLREIVTSLQVHEGRLELWREGVVRLVVLPLCETPVDHEGAAPYPNPR